MWRFFVINTQIVWKMEKGKARSPENKIPFDTIKARLLMIIKMSRENS